MTTHDAVSDATKRIEQYRRLGMAGVKVEESGNLGRTLLIWRKFRDGRETYEALPEWLARATMEAIPMNEPNVARARLLG